MVADRINENVNEHARVRCAAFPGSKQVQTMSWSQATTAVNPRDGRHGLPSDKFGAYFYLTVLHSDFDPDWPIATDWPAVVRGLRGALGLTQAEFAELLQLGRATVERWEAGASKPFRGKGLELLSMVRPHLSTALHAGQALNLAASVVLPHITKPTAEYTGNYIADLLKSGPHDHSDMAAAMLGALSSSRILVAIDPTDDPLEDAYFPLAARLHPNGDLPRWAADLIESITNLGADDRKLVTSLVRRLESSQSPQGR